MADRAVVVIGDVVRSRQHSDRAALQGRVERVLAEVETALPGTQPLAATLGDEFQAVYPDLSSAVRAAVSVRLRLLPDIDTRFGFGVGDFTVFDAGRQPVSQDGPAWWAAREAIGEARQRAGRVRSNSTRMWFGAAAGQATALPAGVVNAYLSCCDELLGRMSGRELRFTLGLLTGTPQTELAGAEGVTQSAVSQALKRSGAHTVVGSLDLLAGPAHP